MEQEDLEKYQKHLADLSDFELLFVIANCTEELVNREREKR